MNPPENGVKKVEQNGRGKTAQMSGLLRGYSEASWKLPGLFYTVLATTKKMATYNDITWDRA